ncbi:hypothetical protein EEB11_16625 [Pseudotabrizicola sediminis]|uniref:Uncharacterized protein n=1 Tax=Pseudotabrizicola sediminis TaxID=2486418 RepID=A0ABY2KIS5_9RHOB|nr:hypothetical protein EEB11_16625 [Pseudotabrizicola sediminis]
MRATDLMRLKPTMATTLLDPRIAGQSKTPRDQKMKSFQNAMTCATGLQRDDVAVHYGAGPSLSFKLFAAFYLPLECRSVEIQKAYEKSLVSHSCGMKNAPVVSRPSLSIRLPDLTDIRRLRRCPDRA